MARDDHDHDDHDDDFGSDDDYSIGWMWHLHQLADLVLLRIYSVNVSLCDELLNQVHYEMH